MTVLSLIAAVARNRAIGKDNRLLWHLPDDMRYFRETTRGKTVIMGRRTWESLPEKFRPLPGRNNIVVSHNPGYVASGAQLATSLAQAAVLADSKENEAFVIGGADLYRQALPIAEKLYLTEITAEFAGDVFFPSFSPSEWQEVSRSPLFKHEGLEYTFAVYRRSAPG